jgi:leucyl-tRNA synthetase
MLSLRNQGMVLGEDNEKMSKSRGNVVAPDALVDMYGADTVRTYLMFFSRWEHGGPWNYDGIKGPYRFIQDVWNLATATYEPMPADDSAERDLRRKTHQTIEKVTADIENFSFNTAIAAMMELRNATQDAMRKRAVSRFAIDEAVDSLLQLLAPIAPHITEALWHERGKPYSIHTQPWPTFDPEIAKEDTITLVVQVNGRVRDRIEISADSTQDAIKATALASEVVQKYLDGSEPRKIIVIKGRLVNIVV